CLRVHGDAIAGTLEDGQIAFACFALTVDKDFTTQYENRSGVAVGQRKFRRPSGAEIHIPQIDGRESFRRTFAPVVIACDDSHYSGVVRQFDIWNLRLEQGLITRFRALVLRAQVHPKLHHLESAAFAREILRMEFLVDDAVASSHPLHVACANLSAAAAGVAMLYLALISNRHGFKAFVWMPAHA